MQSPRGEEADPERSSSRGERDREPQEGRDDTAPPAPQDQSEPSPDDLNPQLHPDNSVQDVAQVPLIPQLSIPNTTEDMEDQMLRLEEEEDEDFLVLDPEHPLLQRLQAALINQFNKRLERINQELREKLAMQKADDNCYQEKGIEVFRIQEQMAKIQTRVGRQQENKAQAEAKHQQAQDQLEGKKSQSSNISSQETKARANVSGLQTEIDNVSLHLVNTQEVSEDLRSKVKTMKNVTRKAGAEKSQAEEQKLKQDLYVERLTKEMQTLVQQIGMYEAQGNAQAEETQATKDALSEVEMESETMMICRKQLLQQWSSNLGGMRRQDEAFTAMQEAVRTTQHQVILHDGEIESYKKSTNEEQEQNEKLTMQLNWSQNDSAASKKLISQKQAEQEALLAHYSTCTRILRETEHTLTRLSKETSAHQAEHIDQRRQLEKESAVRLEFEDKIIAHMQQGLTHNKAAKYSQRLTSKIATLKKEKISQSWELENDSVAVGLECSEVGRRLDNLAITQEALEQEIAKCNKLLTSYQAKISSFLTLLGQKHTTITNFNKKIYLIAASTGHEDASPLQIKVEALTAQIQELIVKINNDKQLWMKQQRVLITLRQEKEDNSNDLLKLQAMYIGMQQNKIHFESHNEVERRDDTELEKDTKMLRGDLLKLESLLCKNGQLSLALGQENALMETDFLHRLKEAEWESVDMQMKHEKTQEENERLIKSLVEAERQIMLWEKKIQLVKETCSTVEVGQGDIEMMKAEIHRMEVRINRLLKQREQLLRESEATVNRWEEIDLRAEVMVHSSNRHTTKAELERVVRGLQLKIKETHKHVAECEKVSRELQGSQVSLSERLAQHKQQLVDLCGTSYKLDLDFLSLQDTKDKNLGNLVALQSSNEKLQGVCEGSYTALSTSKSVWAALQSQMESMHTASTILLRVCEKFPQHQGALCRLSVALATKIQALEQEMS